MRKEYKVGDYLLVKETFWSLGNWFTDKETGENHWQEISYLYIDNDEKPEPSNTEYVFEDDGTCKLQKAIWRKIPSIFMKRDHCRILLEITAVRKCRLQDIVVGECLSEGIDAPNEKDSLYKIHANLLYNGIYKSFVDLWDSINGKFPGKAWMDNPKVIMYQFKVLSSVHKIAQEKYLYNFYNCHFILFRADMVKAIIEGRKTQTTRIIKE